MKKKLVSILLVFCMILGIMPTSLVSAAEVITAEYVFRLAGEQHDKANADTAKAYADSFSENWSWYGKSWASDAATTAIFRQSNKATYNVNDRIYVQNIAVGEWFALDIRTPEVSGAYAVDFDYSRLSSSNAGASDIYLIEKPSGDFNKDAVNAALGNSSPIGNIDCGGSSVSLEKLTKKLNNIIFEEGKSYLLVFKATRAAHIPINGMKFSKLGELTEITVSVESEKIAIGSSASVAVSGKDSNGTVLQESAFDSISYNSSNEAVATVSDGVITGVANGTATITVTATLGNVTKTQDVSITVFKGNLAGVDKDYVFSYVSDAWTANSGESKPSAVGITYADTNGGDWEWFGTNSEGVRARVFWYKAGTGCRLQVSGMAVGEWFALTFKAPKSGKYLARLGICTYGTDSGTGESDVYILPKPENKDITALLNSDTLVASLDFYEALPTAGETADRFVPIRNLDLEKDKEYIIVFKQTADGILRPNSLNLIGDTGDLASVDCSVDKPSFGEGETAKIIVTAKDTKGNVLYADNLDDITYKSGDENLAVVSEDGTITGIADGFVTITVTAKFGDVEKSKDITIRVGSEKISKLSSTLNRQRIDVNEDAKINFYAESTFGNKLGAEDVDELTYSTEDDEIISVSEDGVITGLSYGKATVKIEAVMGRETASQELEILVSKPLNYSHENVKYNFIDIQESWDPTLPNMGFDDNPGKKEDIRGITYEHTGSGNWEWYGTGPDWQTKPSGAYAYSGTGDPQWRLRLNVAKDKWMGLTIKVPASGKYKATLRYAAYGMRESSGASDIYIIPKDAGNPDDMLMENYYLGNVDYYTSALDGKNEFDYGVAELSDVEFTHPGEYILMFRQTADGNNKFITVQSLELTGDAIEGVECDFPEEIDVGTTSPLSFVVRHIDGSEFSRENIDFVSFETSAPDIATVDIDGNVTAVADGKAKITINVKVYGLMFAQDIPITVVDRSEVLGIEVEAPKSIYVNSYGSQSVATYAKMGSGAKIKIDNADVVYTVEGEEYATLNEDFTLKALGAGTVKISAQANFRGGTYSSEAFEVSFIAGMSKTEPVMYTYEKREQAKKNIAKYSWAKSEAKSTIKAADNYVDSVDAILNSMIGEGIPRSIRHGENGEIEYAYCKYCGGDVVGKYGHTGAGGWTINPITRPWKIQCPDCKRLFPSNDFESFMELGLDENGRFDVEEAHRKHKELFAEDYARTGSDTGYGYLKNDLYPEVAKVKTLNVNRGLRDGETVEGWAVDDGFGYLPKDKNGKRFVNNGIPERHSAISIYHLYYWEWLRKDVVPKVMNAYLYTGDAKYGRAGALLVDRFADIMPDYHMDQYRGDFYFIGGGTQEGKIVGRINDCNIFEVFARATDAFFPMIYDKQVQAKLQETARKYNLSNDKSTPEQIWQNWADGILIETFESVKVGEIWGNFGMMQEALAIAAVSLDDEAKTDEMLDFVFQSGSHVLGVTTGGNLGPQLINVVDRDGLGNEVGPNYNVEWLKNLLGVAEALESYKGKKDFKLFGNPRYSQMFAAFNSLALADSFTVQLGDSASVASLGYSTQVDTLTKGLEYLRDTPFAESIAKQLYRQKKYNVDDMHYSIFFENPETMIDDIEKYVSDIPEQKSEILTGYGFAVLRDGIKTNNSTASSYTNTLRDFWITFTNSTADHSHRDTLAIGLEAYGLNMAPDLGYPVQSAGAGETNDWTKNTIAHNTVVVNGGRTKRIEYHAHPKHFDDSGLVKLFDIDSPKSYTVAPIFRRTLVMIKVDDEISYGVDFFRIKGGNRHEYSFHAQSDSIHDTEGLKLIKQVDENGNYVGTLAGPDTEFGVDASGKHQVGYTFFKNVRYDLNPQKQFSVDFNITDFRKAIKDSKDLHLKLTMLNDFELSRVAIAGGNVPQKKENLEMPKTLEYVIAEHSGEDGLDSLFTTVLEPYKKDRYLSEMSIVPIIVKSGEEGADDAAHAIKVTYVNGNTDYIVYATNKDVVYTISDENVAFDFSGFIGVYRINKDGKNIYRYVQDGTIIGTESPKPSSYKGQIAGFTRELETENFINVRFTEDVDVNDLAGRCIFVDNDKVQNGAYRIVDATELEDGTVNLDIGAVSVIRSYRDDNNIYAGYNYNIEKGQSFEIPTSYSEDGSPVFVGESDSVTVSAGSTIEVKVNAESISDDIKITYTPENLPRGATLDSETGVFTWKPDSSQVGANYVAINAVDSEGRISTHHFMVMVHGSTTGGGSGAPAPSTPSTPSIPTTPSDEKDNTAGSTDNVGDGVPDVPQTPSVDASKRFIDLENHGWAEDAINSLADEGIIKGTSENTFSPAANITRADFAVLLVRAFKLASENGENFADVSDSDYFAKELAIARNTGLINGIGENKFAPRNNITRQDMMVIVYRALSANEKLVGAIHESPAMADFDKVADYAKEAVSALVNAKLVNGKNGFIDPLANTTRAEVAVLLKRISDYTK